MFGRHILDCKIHVLATPIPITEEFDRHLMFFGYSQKFLIIVAPVTTGSVYLRPGSTCPARAQLTAAYHS